MRKLLFLAAALTAAPVIAQDGPAIEPVVTAKPGAIVMYRSSSIMGAGIACPIRYKGAEVTELGRGKFTRWEVPAGRYILTNKTASVEISVEPGETRYVRCQIKAGFLTGRADLQVVDQESFTENQADYEEKPAAISPPAPGN